MSATKRILPLLCLALTGCSGGGSSNPAAPATILNVSGTYRVLGIMIENGCQVEGENFDTNMIVKHRQPGGNQITMEVPLVITFAGHVSPSGGFTVRFDREDGAAFATVTGTFSEDGFVATFDFRTTAPCITTMRWNGDKQGDEPNTFPG